jgi:hypothetical protein
MAYSNRYGAMAEYSRSQPVRDRNYGGLTAWSATQMTQPIPPSPTDDWIRLYLLAQRVPQSPDSYTQRIAPYMVQVSAIQSHICLHTAPFLEDPDYQTVEQDIEAGLAVVMPQIAAIDISQSQIDQWRTDNSYPATTTTSTTTPAPTTTP